MLDTEPRLSVTICFVALTWGYWILERDSIVSGELFPAVLFVLSVVTLLFNVALHFPDSRALVRRLLD
ncbi:hypothetical protein [Haloarchaeobius sp. DFWS5]|uniref:hypothetical protein n=1 Tax=Haloarchaeobius sp. DFWS5 TaxID=3446114 RepID=UPI003EBB333A